MKLLLIALALTGCSTIIKTPINRFESPEVVGETLGAQFHGGWQGVTEAVITEDTYNIPINVDTPRIRSDHRPIAGGGIGLFQFLELQLRSPSLLQLKFQVLGDPFKKAKAGNVSLAWTAGYGNPEESSSFLGSSCDIQEHIYDASVILGWRPTDDLLLYSSASGNWNHFSGRQTIYSGTTNFSGWHRAKGVNLGAEVRAKNLFLRAEGGAAEVRLNQSRSTQRSAGVILGAVL